MPSPSLLHREKILNFEPRVAWPEALPAYAWEGLLLTAFSREPGQPVVDLFCGWLEAWLACYPAMSLSELARLYRALQARPELWQKHRAELLAHYGLRASARLDETLACLSATPRSFQDFVDDKKWGARDLAPLLALPEVSAVFPVLKELATLSKTQAVQALETSVELFLMGHSLADLLPLVKSPTELERLRRPRTHAADQMWREKVAAWPWPAQVEGEWQRRGDESGLQIRLHARSAEDLAKKIERLKAIQEAWSCT